MLPVFTDSNDITTELVAYDGGILCAIIGNTLMVLTLQSRLISRHTNTVTDHTDLYIIRAYLRKCDLL
jgi:hypothetical protein